MSERHVEEVAQIHAESWNPKEISVKLGRSYLQFFYQQIVNSPHAFGFVYMENGRVIAYAAGFYNYREFNRAMKQSRVRLGTLALFRILTGGLSFADIRMLMGDEHKLRKLKYADHHLGALALAPKYKGTPVGKTAITSAIGAVIDEIRNEGFGGIWGVCDDENVPMKKYLWKLGFADVDVVSYPGRKAVVFEMSFTK